MVQDFFHKVAGDDSYKISARASSMVVYGKTKGLKVATNGNQDVPEEQKEKLSGIEIKTPPDKTEYNVGEDFDRAGMVVRAIYKKAGVETRRETVTDYQVLDGNNLQLEQNYVMIKYGEYLAQQSITVVANIYATLYTDGTLGFCSTEETIEGKTSKARWYITDANATNTPWYQYRNEITNAIFTNKVYPKSTAKWFYNLTNLTTINNIENLDTSRVTDMSYMFNLCSGLTSLDVSSFDTSNVTKMDWMFCGCKGLTSLDISSFDTSNVTDMSCMFDGCSNLKELKINRVNTSKVTDMERMFRGCSKLSNLDLSDFDTSSVTNMDSMFESCSTLKELNVSSFDTSNVTDMSSMFSTCYNFSTLDLSSFDTSNVTDMSHMFYGLRWTICPYWC